MVREQAVHPQFWNSAVTLQKLPGAGEIFIRAATNLPAYESSRNPPLLGFTRRPGLRNQTYENSRNPPLLGCTRRPGLPPPKKNQKQLTMTRHKTQAIDNQLSRSVLPSKSLGASDSNHLYSVPFAPAYADHHLISFGPWIFWSPTHSVDPCSLFPVFLTDAGGRCLFSCLGHIGRSVHCSM